MPLIKPVSYEECRVYFGDPVPDRCIYRTRRWVSELALKRYYRVLRHLSEIPGRIYGGDRRIEACNIIQVFLEQSYLVGLRAYAKDNSREGHGHAFCVLKRDSRDKPEISAVKCVPCLDSDRTVDRQPEGVLKVFDRRFRFVAEYPVDADRTHRVVELRNIVKVILERCDSRACIALSEKRRILLSDLL